MGLSEAYDRSVVFIKERWKSIVGTTTMILGLTILMFVLFLILASGKMVEEIGSPYQNLSYMSPEFFGVLSHTVVSIIKLAIVFFIIYVVLSQIISYPLYIVWVNHVHNKKSGSILSYFSWDMVVRAVKLLVLSILIGIVLAVISFLITLGIGLIVYLLASVLNVSSYTVGVIVIIIFGILFLVSASLSSYKAYDLFIYHKKPFFTCLVDSVKFGLNSLVKLDRVGTLILIFIIYLAGVSLLSLVLSPLSNSTAGIIIKYLINTYVTSILAYLLYSYPLLYLIVHEWSPEAEPKVSRSKTKVAPAKVSKKTKERSTSKKVSSKRTTRKRTRSRTTRSRTK